MILRKFLKRFLSSEDGPTAVEYAVMLAMILVACLAAVTNLGGSASGKFTSVSDGLGGQGIGSKLEGGSSVSDGIWTASHDNPGNGVQTDTYNAKTGEWSATSGSGTTFTQQSDIGKLPPGQMGAGAYKTWTRIK